jgi:hypothetical protein
MTIKVDLTATIVNELDKPITEGETPLTMRVALKRLALADLDGNGNPIKGDSKLPRYELFLKLKKADAEDTIELTPEEATLLREGARVYPTVIMGQVRAALA